MSGSNVSDELRKRKLLRYINETRQRLIRLLVLVSWHKAEAKKVPVVEQCMLLLQNCENYTLGLRTASDNLAFLHDELRNLLQPKYDTETALDILCSSKLPLMPSSIQDVAPDAQGGVAETTTGADGGDGNAALKRLSTATYMKLLDMRDALADSFTGIDLRVSNGRAHITCPDMFEVIVALDPMALHLKERANKSDDASAAVQWSLQEVKLLMSLCGGKEILSANQMAKMKFQLQQVLAERREKDPIPSVVQYMKELTSKLVLYTCSSQLNDLVAENYKGKLRKLIKKEDPLQPGQLRCLYWVEPQKDMRTYVELSLDDKDFKCNCRNKYQSTSSNFEMEMKIDTQSISVERVIWEGASRMSEMIIRCLREKFSEKEIFQRINHLGMSLCTPSCSPRMNKLEIHTADSCVLGMTVDIYTGRLLLSSMSNQWSNSRMVAHVRRFNAKFAHMLACVSESLVNGVYLAQLVSHLIQLLEKMHSAIILEEVGCLVWSERKTRFREMKPSTETATRILDLARSNLDHCRELILLGRDDVQSAYVAFCVGDEGLSSYAFKMGKRKSTGEGKGEAHLQGKEFLGKLDFNSLALSGKHASVTVSKKRKLDEIPKPRHLAEFVNGVLGSALALS